MRTECKQVVQEPSHPVAVIVHLTGELLGQRIYGLCLGYEDLNDHDQLRTDPMLAVAVNKADPLGERRRQASDRGKRCTLNRLELTGAEVDEQERYKKIAMDPDRIDGWMVDAFVESHESAPEEIVLDLDATDDPIHGQQEGRFFHVTTATTVISRCTSSRGSICCAPGCGVPISMGPRDRWRNWNGSSAGFGRAGQRSRSSSGPTRAFAGMTCSVGVKTITWIT